MSLQVYKRVCLRVPSHYEFIFGEISPAKSCRFCGSGATVGISVSSDAASGGTGNPGKVDAKNETLPPMSGWVKVTDRLPDENSRWWVRAIRRGGEEMFADVYFNTTWGWGYIEDQGYSEKPVVTHYHPLPAPPTEEE